jgi:hypothetical protein
MGLDELSGNGITQKILYFLKDHTMTPYDEPLRRVRKSRIILFVAIQLIAFGATFAITQTVGMARIHVLTLDEPNVDLLCLLFAHHVSRGRIPYHHPAVSPATGVGNATLTVLPGRDGYP